MRQKNVSKEQIPRVKNTGERMFVDISSNKHKSAGGQSFGHCLWMTAVFFLINRFLREKSDLARLGAMLIKKLNDKHGIRIKVIRYDNAGEYKKMEEACDKLGLGTKFEYTAVGTLQQNGRIE